MKSLLYLIYSVVLKPKFCEFSWGIFEHLLGITSTKAIGTSYYCGLVILLQMVIVHLLTYKCMWILVDLQL